ncbi:MAG: hypothetical protein RLY43_1580 [Bacteroidota bacterium]|jgi:prepilin-type N-terminal cleavage/methylation domain-containing protein
MKINYKKGFTLIELLVVIAIIGILSSVVLASLSSARDKGNTAAIKSTLVNVRTQAELVYAGDYSFASVCTDSVILRAISEVEDLNGGETVVCNDGATSWAIASVTENGAFCVDADGVAEEYADLTSAITGTNTSCN